MAIFMRKHARVAGSFLLLAGLSACDSGTAITLVNIKGIKGQFVVTTSGINIPLSANRNLVEYRYGSAKETLFSGYGSDPILMVDRPNALLVIAACDSREIEKLAGAFNEKLSSADQDSQYYRVQLINSAGFSYRGKPICASQTGPR